MKSGKVFLISFIFLVVVLGISAASAADSDNVAVNMDNNDISTVNGVQNAGFDLNVESDNQSNSGENSLSSSNRELGEVFVIEDDGENNEMENPTIQPAIDNAKANDTIIINGKSYVHCHFVIDKPLTILSNVSTKMSPCSSNTKGSGHLGIFYVTPEASGTVIEGFTLVTNLGRGDDYSILVDGAANVIIRNCEIKNNAMADPIRLENTMGTIIDTVTANSLVNGINIKDSQNVIVNNSVFKNSNIGVNIVGSSQITLTNNVITSNKASGIRIDEKTSYATISNNNVTNNEGMGIDAESANNLFILNNYIALNKNRESGAGIYINSNVTKLDIKGNFLKSNGNYGILYDYRVRNIGPYGEGEDLANISNNYMFGHTDRAIYHITYVKDSKGSFVYDAENDVYDAVGYGNGDYGISMTTAYLGYNFLINDALCPSIYFTWDKLWSAGNYRLSLSNISQIKKGEYSVSVINPNGGVAEDLSSIYVTFYLNKQNTRPTPQEGDIYKTVLLQNGTATVKFSADVFKESGNVVSASLPGPNPSVDSNPYKKLPIEDSEIPGNALETVLSLSNLTTYPNSGEYLIANLKDISGNPLSNQNITFEINSKKYVISTDENGDAKLKTSISKEGRFTVSAKFDGDGEIYFGSEAQSNLVVRKVATKIMASNLCMVPTIHDYLTVVLKDSNGNPISNQKIAFTLGKNTCYRVTNSKGQASLMLTYNKDKVVYRMKITYSGSNMYLASAASSNIYVKYSSKTPELIAPTINVAATLDKCYVITLKGMYGNALANQKLTFDIDGVRYVKYTNANGNVAVLINFKTVNKYKVHAVYDGNKIYEKVSVHGWINVIKIFSKFEAQDTTMLPKEQKEITAFLTNTAGGKLANQKVTIKTNGMTINRITDAIGKFTFKVSYADENKYPISLSFSGNAVYKSASLKVYANVKKVTTSIESFDKTFSRGSAQNFTIALKDQNGNGLANQNVIFIFNGENITKVTDSSGHAGINVASNVGQFKITTKYVGSDKYSPVSATNNITVLNDENIVYIDSNLPNSEIQKILDACEDGDIVKFLGDEYDDISLAISKQLDISSIDKTTINAKQNCPAFKVLAENTHISDFIVVANSGDAIDVSAGGVKIANNNIINKLDSSKISEYYNSTISLPGYGIAVSNAKNIELVNNSVALFESAIFAEKSCGLTINANILGQNNYGIKYGFDVEDSQITGNLIADCIGLYTLEVPEGPRGYGIFLNNSAVNVVITNNSIVWGHLGISIDANGSTGIVVTGNLITDNVLEGIRFNAGYDLAENAIEPLITDNAIYRNARGPSMMILGEMSANPGGIYGPGQWDDDAKLKIAPNWYGVNALQTWDNDTGIVGIGTMCPRIKTTEIKFDEIVAKAPGSYSVTFTKNGEVASNLCEFDLYATLNHDVEVNFKVVNGVGEFSFDASEFKDGPNVIEISVGSLNSQERVFKSFYNYQVPENEVPV